MIEIERATLRELEVALGGEVAVANQHDAVRSLAALAHASAGQLAFVFARRALPEALVAIERGALLVATPELARELPARAAWVHAHADWVLARLLARANAERAAPVVGTGTRLSEHVVLRPGVRVGARVRIEAGCVIGRPGFGWVASPDGKLEPMPQLGGVEIEDDVWVGPLSTIDAGTLAPTRIRRGAKLDAHVHVGHNVEIGEDAMVAAQCGFAGSVRVGRGVRIGGQVGVADHVRIGDGAQIAAKSGVIGDVPAGAVFAGYPAVERGRWLRRLARGYAFERRPRSDQAAEDRER